MTQNPHPQHERVERLIALTERLTGLISEQAQAFENRRPQDAARNMEEASKLANLYRHEAQRMRAEPKGALADLPLAQRTRLIRATEAFDAVIARQGRALAAAKTVTEGLVHAIAQEVASQRDKNAVYGPGGAKPSASATSVTLNQRA
jgi:hypothetical protein